jgi:hypothetical protein
MVAKSALQHTAPALLVLSAMLAAGNWYLQPDRAWSWASSLLLIGGMALALLFVPRNKSDANRRTAGDAIRSGVVFAGLMLAIALSLKLGMALGAISDADLARRATMVILGAFFAFTGNGMPKTLTPLAALQCDPARVQAFQRFAGWTWVLTGLAFAIVWLLLPLGLAKPVSVVLLMSGMLAIAVQLTWLRTTRRREA